MDEEIKEIQQRIDVVWDHIRNLPASRTRFDLGKMHDNVVKMLNQLQQEMVNCRRNKKTSQRALSLLKEIQENLDHLEQYLTMGILISK